MNIPQKADKWIAFMLILALGRVEYSRSTGIHFAPVEWLVGSVVIAVLLTIAYVWVPQTSFQRKLKVWTQCSAAAEMGARL